MLKNRDEWKYPKSKCQFTDISKSMIQNESLNQVVSDMPHDKYM